MRIFDVILGLLRGLLLLPLACILPAAAQDAKPFSKEQLDQMTAQVALYPDSLLSQLLMATTYPDEFAAAYNWSKAHPDAKGDDAVQMVENEGWDPSVASMVGFPEVLITLGEKTDWVKNLGDAFLAQPEDVMDSVQRLRAHAEKAGNLKSNEQVKVSAQAAPAPQAGAPAAASPQVIVIEPAQPSVVYVPAYNPTVVYGAWPYPAYPPYYYPPPPGYWFSRTVATGIAWGVGIGVSNALWGGFNWDRRDVNININRYNNINVNNRLDRHGGRTNWNHNPDHRKTAYRGGDETRQRLDKRQQIANREHFRGKDGSRDASRGRATQAMQRRGFEPPAGSARDRAQTMNRDAPRQLQGAANRDATRERAQGVDRDALRGQQAQAGNRDNALRGVSSGQARAQAERGAASYAAVQRGGRDGARAGGGATRAGGGGAGARGGGGGGRGQGGGRRR